MTLKERYPNVKFIDEKSTFIDDSVEIGNNVIIYENNRIEGNSKIADDVKVLRGNHIVDTIIGKGTTIEMSHTKEAEVGEQCDIGPWARLRPEAVVKSRAKIGNFVEIKKAVIGEGTKVSHLAYVGNAEIGKDCNIGCGAIFVNYNGKIKGLTKVGDNCFIGSNCNIIAPVEIADDCYVCAGTTVTENLKEKDFAIGRSRQIVKSDRATKYLKKWKNKTDDTYPGDQY